MTVWISDFLRDCQPLSIYKFHEN